MEIELIKDGEIAETCDMISHACKHSLFAEFYPPRPQYFSATFEELKEKAENGHLYVVKDGGKIIGCGGIGAYRGSKTESLLGTIFVAPDRQGEGVGRTIVEFLERDEYATWATRLEIHAAISAIPFYRKLGYEHKDGQLCYSDGRFALEKFPRKENGHAQ